MNRLTFSWMFVLVFAAGCSGVISTGEETKTVWPTVNWNSSPPEKQGMDPGDLEMLDDLIRNQDYAIDNLTIVRHGYVVFDEYFANYTSDDLHVINSCTKSIVSILIGIAIDRGYIESVNIPLVDIFPNREILYLDSEKEMITLEDLLTMSSGLNCRDSYLYRWAGIYEMRKSNDWVQFMLDLPMAETPGTHFEYCNGGSFLLSAILQEMTGKPASSFAEENLFEPLGVNDVIWPANPNGINIGWGEIRMKPLDMAKIGYLYLNGGLWDGEQIVSADWVDASTKQHIKATLSDGYGYQWWVDAQGFYMALGYAGQFIYVVPEKDLVVVFTSDLEEYDFYLPEQLLTRYILPAVKD